MGRRALKRCKRILFCIPVGVAKRRPPPPAEEEEDSDSALALANDVERAPRVAPSRICADEGHAPDDEIYTYFHKCISTFTISF